MMKKIIFILAVLLLFTAIPVFAAISLQFSNNHYLQTETVQIINCDNANYYLLYDPNGNIGSSGWQVGSGNICNQPYIGTGSAFPGHDWTILGTWTLVECATPTDYPCASPLSSATFDNTFPTTFVSVPWARFINSIIRPLHSSDRVLIGALSPSTSNLFEVEGTGYFSGNTMVMGNMGVGSTSPTSRLEVNQFGDPVSFTHTDNGSEVDAISANVHLTRGTSNPLYNSVTESSYTAGVSPADTEWNAGGVADLSDVTSRTYGDLKSIGQAAFGSLNSLPGNYMVMHAITDDVYYKIKFISWTPSAGGGGFSYTRQRIDLTIPYALSVDGTSFLNGNVGIKGRVGINKTSPSYPLDVTGDINVTGSYRVNGTALTATQWTTLGSDIYYNTGKVGISTTTPATPLDVYGTTTALQLIVAPPTWSGTTGKTGWVFENARESSVNYNSNPANSALFIYPVVNVQPRMYFGTSTRKIGTINFENVNSFEGVPAYLGLDGFTHGFSAVSHMIGRTGNDVVLRASGSASNIIFQENTTFNGTTERMRITSNGIGIATTTPLAQFDVVGPFGSTTPLFRVGSTTAANVVSTKFTILANGKIGVGTTTPNALLDIFGGGIKYESGGVSQPTCDASQRGLTWFTEGAAGVKDKYEICAKDAGDAYAWRTIY